MNSSVVELIELINGHIPDILFMEASNLSQIYLYRTDDYWVAFERSAFLLCRAYADSIITPMKVANAPTPIAMASVKVKNMLEATRNLHCLRDTEKLRIYDARNLSCNNASFSRWHNWKVKNIVCYLSRKKRMES